MRKDPITVDQIAGRMIKLLQQRNALSRDDLEYVVETVAKLKDERLKSCIAELIGYPIDGGGLLVSGGNMANFVCFLVARSLKAGWDIRKSGLRHDSTARRERH